MPGRHRARVACTGARVQRGGAAAPGPRGSVPVMRDAFQRPTVVALSGGIGGAKLVWGLHRVLDTGALGVVANVGDDFAHLGLAICPDIDTLLYTLSGLADPVRGWGRRDET